MHDGARPGQEIRRPSREQAGRGAVSEAQTSRTGRKRQPDGARADQAR